MDEIFLVLEQGKMSSTENLLPAQADVQGEVVGPCRLLGVNINIWAAETMFHCTISCIRPSVVDKHCNSTTFGFSLLFISLFACIVWNPAFWYFNQLLLFLWLTHHNRWWKNEKVTKKKFHKVQTNIDRYCNKLPPIGNAITFIRINQFFRLQTCGSFQKQSGQ